MTLEEDYVQRSMQKPQWQLDVLQEIEWQRAQDALVEKALRSVNLRGCSHFRILYKDETRYRAVCMKCGHTIEWEHTPITTKGISMEDTELMHGAFEMIRQWIAEGATTKERAERAMWAAGILSGREPIEQINEEWDTYSPPGEQRGSDE